MHGARCSVVNHQSLPLLQPLAAQPSKSGRPQPGAARPPLLRARMGSPVILSNTMLASGSMPRRLLLPAPAPASPLPAEVEAGAWPAAALAGERRALAALGGVWGVDARGEAAACCGAPAAAAVDAGAASAGAACGGWPAGPCRLPPRAPAPPPCWLLPRPPAGRRECSRMVSRASSAGSAGLARVCLPIRWARRSPNGALGAAAGTHGRRAGREGSCRRHPLSRLNACSTFSPGCSMATSRFL
jgi:hypothetical protein